MPVTPPTARAEDRPQLVAAPRAADQSAPAPGGHPAAAATPVAPAAGTLSLIHI